MMYDDHVHCFSHRVSYTMLVSFTSDSLEYHFPLEESKCVLYESSMFCASRYIVHMPGAQFLIVII